MTNNTMIKVTVTAYDYWYSCDRSGWRKIERFFTTKEKAEAWIEAHKDMTYASFKGENKAKDEYEMPKFKTEEIEVDRED